MSPQFNSVEAQTLLTICQKVQIESPAKTRDGSERNFPALKDWKLCENLTPTDATAVMKKLPEAVFPFAIHATE